MSPSRGSVCLPRWCRPSAPRKLKINCVDEFRRAREDLEPDFYNALTYFELWTEGFINLMEEKGVLTRAEVEARVAEHPGQAEEDRMSEVANSKFCSWR